MFVGGQLASGGRVGAGRIQAALDCVACVVASTVESLDLPAIAESIADSGRARNIERVARALGVFVFDEQDLFPHGVCCCNVILVNADAPPIYREQIIAHELAHLLLTRELPCNPCKRCDVVEASADLLAALLVAAIRRNAYARKLARNAARKKVA